MRVNPEPWEDDYSPNAASRVTHVAQSVVVFRAVMADARDVGRCARDRVADCYGATGGVCVGEG